MRAAIHMTPLPPNTPATLRSRFDRIEGQRHVLRQSRVAKAARLQSLSEYLALGPAIEEALDKLSEELFGKLAAAIERHLTAALREVLDQPISLKVVRDFKRGGATMRFEIHRDGNAEDVMRGQGGSVANILSVGLRVLALAQLDPKQHRRFLVLDEQDCWLAPDLVPRLVKIVHLAAKELGFQILMISHHDISAFERYADKIYRITPTPDGVAVGAIFEGPLTPDAG